MSFVVRCRQRASCHVEGSVDPAAWQMTSRLSTSSFVLRTSWRAPRDADINRATRGCKETNRSFSATCGNPRKPEARTHLERRTKTARTFEGFWLGEDEDDERVIGESDLLSAKRSSARGKHGRGGFTGNDTENVTPQAVQYLRTQKARWFCRSAQSGGGLISPAWLQRRRRCSCPNSACESRCQTV